MIPETVNKTPNNPTNGDTSTLIHDSANNSLCKSPSSTWQIYSVREPLINKTFSQHFCRRLEPEFDKAIEQ